MERDPSRLLTHRLVGDRYELSGEWPADESAGIVEPFPVIIALSALIP